MFNDSVTAVGWHTDVPYELQPPSYTFFGVLEGPAGGGDTLFSDSITAFERLSPTFQEFLSTLHVVHSSKEQAQNSANQGGIQRREPVAHVHPLVRVHPVTGEKCLFVNGEFITKIQGLKEPEQRWLLDFLMQHIITGHDFQARVRWQPRTIVIFDNRCTTREFLVTYQR